MAKINSRLNLFLRNVYSYDISSCHYRLMEKMGFDISDIDQENKEKRNIQIGKRIKDSPILGEILRETTNNLISEYLTRNDIKEEEVVIRLYDGFICTKKLKETTKYIQIDLRSIYQYMVTSVDRLRYIALDTNNNAVIKGLANRYPEMDKVLEELLRINFNSKNQIFKSLQDIKNKILSSDNEKLFCIPVTEDKYSVFFKGYGQLIIGKSSIRMLDTDEIDKEKYFNLYVRPFTESIVLEFK